MIENEIGSEDTLMHKAGRPINYFFPTLSHITEQGALEVRSAVVVKAAWLWCRKSP